MDSEHWKSSNPYLFYFRSDIDCFIKDAEVILRFCDSCPKRPAGFAYQNYVCPSGILKFLYCFQSSGSGVDMHMVVGNRNLCRHFYSLIHISEPTRLRRISYAVFCLKKKKTQTKKIREVLHNKRKQTQKKPNKITN